MSKKTKSDQSSAVHNTYSAPKKSSIWNYLSSWLKGDILRQCPYCDDQLTEIDMIQHLKQCQQVTYSATRPDGTMTSVTYAGANKDIIRESLGQLTSGGRKDVKYNTRS